MRELGWFEPGEALMPSEIEAAEIRLGVKFPADYAGVVSLNSGASNPDECEFEYFDKGKRCTSNFGALLSLRDEVPDNVFETVENFGQRLPRGVIPIVDTGLGDYVCLDYRKSAIPSIAYFAHESRGEEAIITLSSSFSDFLSSLQLPDEE